MVNSRIVDFAVLFIADSALLTVEIKSCTVLTLIQKLIIRLKGTLSIQSDETISIQHIMNLTKLKVLIF